MKAFFDKDRVLNIVAENNVESMAIEYFTDKRLPVLYQSPAFDNDGNEITGIAIKDHTHSS